MVTSLWVRFLTGAGTCALALLAGRARADLDPEWVASLPVGTSLGAGIRGIVVDASGVSYVTGVTGPSGNTDVITAAFGPDGSLRWSHTYNGPGDWHDSGNAVALAPGGVLYVTGGTPDAMKYSKVLLLAYDAATGALLDALQYSSGPFTSEAGRALATDADGGVFIGGSTVGDGGDALILKYDAARQFQWKRTWDGPADAPYSQDSVRQVQIDPDGDLVVLIHGVMSSLHPDYVVLKYTAGGKKLWEAIWGVAGEDSPNDMVIEPTGDIYVTGTGIDFNDRFSTIKLRGGDGTLLWQAYDSAGASDHGVAVALDGAGGVLITGSSDPDGDHSNFNDNIYTVRRDAGSGALDWSHEYGLNGVGCYDVPSDVIVDPEGHVFVAGSTSSAPYSGDTITLVLDVSSGAEIERGVVSGGPTESAAPFQLRFDGAFNLRVGGELYDFNSGDVAISVLQYGSLLCAFDGCFVDLGHGLAGDYAPRLQGSGSLAAGESFTLSFTDMPPGRGGPLFVGFTLWEIPFMGGVLVPSLDWVLPLDTGSGALDLDASMPPGIPSELSLYLQAWFPDAGGARGLCATNGLQLIAP